MSNTYRDSLATCSRELFTTINSVITVPSEDKNLTAPYYLNTVISGSHRHTPIEASIVKEPSGQMFIVFKNLYLNEEIKESLETKSVIQEVRQAIANFLSKINCKDK